MATAPTKPSSGLATEAARIPPHDLDAEMAALGSMMLDRQAIEAILEVINREEGDWFYRPDHRIIFQLLLDVYDRGDPMDLFVVQDELKRRDQLDQVGGTEYIVSLAESVPTWVNAEYYARIVRDKGLLRDVISCSGRIAETAYADAEPVAEILDGAEAALFSVTERRVSQQAACLGDLVTALAKQLEESSGEGVTGVETGYYPLDHYTGGFQYGDLIIVAGRPSMGKTSLGLNMAEHIAVDNKLPSVFFSLEMNRSQVAQRVLAGHAGVDLQKLRKHSLDEEETFRLVNACAALASAPLYVDDTAAISIMELRGKARRLQRQYGIQIIFVDYLQLMHAASKRDSREQEISAISRGLKALARELKVPIVAMAQLNRLPEGREGHRPRMSDLRESGAIEQDADVVLLLHREEYYHPDDPNNPEWKGKASLIIAKQRNGPTGSLELQFTPHLARFRNLAVSPTADEVVAYSRDTPF